jgi:hypothetical protein
MNDRRLNYSVACLLVAWCAPAAANPWEVSYKGPDTLTLVTRPNRAGSNVRSALLHARELPAGTWAQILPPLIGDALQRCSMQGVSAVNVESAPAADKIGDTPTRIEGLGIYVNLAAASRASTGNWYLAPYYSIKVSLAGEGSPDTQAILEFDRLAVPTDFMNEDAFLEVRTEDVQKTVVAFVKKTLPVAVSRAFPLRCAPAAGISK